MTAAEISSIAWTRRKLAMSGHRFWETEFALWGLSDRPAGIKAVVGCHFDAERLPDQVEEILACFQDAGQPANWMLGPSALPADLSKYLRSQRRLMGPMLLPGMELDLRRWKSEPNQHPVKILENLGDIPAETHPTALWYPKAQRPDTMVLLQELVASGDVIPFGCYIGGELAGALTLFIHDGIAGVYDVVTKPEFRGTGVGTAVLDAALRLAKDMGCEVAALQSHKKAIGLYARQGFVETGLFKSMYYSRVRLAADKAARL